MEDKIKSWLILIMMIVILILGIKIQVILIAAWSLIILIVTSINSHELFHSKYVSKVLKYRRVVKNRKFYRLGGLKKSYTYIYKIKYDFKSYCDPYVIIYFSENEYDKQWFRLENRFNNSNRIRKILKSKAD